MESKVSDPGGFAFSLYGESKINKNIINLLNECSDLKFRLQCKLILYSHKKCNKINRSARLLTPAHLECYNIEVLKGVGEFLVYKCNLKK